MRHVIIHRFLALFSVLLLILAGSACESEGGGSSSDLVDGASSDVADALPDGGIDSEGPDADDAEPPEDAPVDTTDTDGDQPPEDGGGEVSPDSGNGDASDGEVVDGECEPTATSDLPGVRVEFTGDRCSWGIDEAQTGIEIPYRVIVDEEVSGVVPQPQDGGGCGQPGDSGLIVFEDLGGEGQRYCLCDVGLCAPPSEDPVTLEPGTYPGSFEWYGRNWSGPSDTGMPRGEPFPPGSYSLEVSAVGEVDGEAFEVAGSFPVELTPAAAPRDPALIRAGWFFGECVGACQYGLFLSPDQVQLQIRTWSEEILVDNFGKLTDEGVAQADERALQLFDAELQEEYGCPDCDDGGGAFVKLRRKGDESTHTYELGKPPAVLSAADAFARDVIQALRTCTDHDWVEPDDECQPE